MAKTTSHFSGLIKQVVNLVKYTFLLLITLIALLTGALVVLFNLYRREKRPNGQSSSDSGEAAG